MTPTSQRAVPTRVVLPLALIWMSAALSGMHLVHADDSTLDLSTSTIAADLDGDGVEETVVVYRNESTRRGFLTVTVGASEAPHLYTSPIYPLWAVHCADIDGDGASELVLGIWSEQHRHQGEPTPSRTVWVLRWDSERLVEVWRGSALARPILDFGLADLDRDQVGELVALETHRDRCAVTAYRWNGFGFVGVASMILSCDTLEFCPTGGDRPDAACLRTLSGESWIERRGRRLVLVPFSSVGQ